jgi:shikimate dehydrogenase
MHNAAFRAAQIDAVYVPLAASDFADFIAFADALSLEGASVTAPFKRDAFSVAAEADDISARIGAANTLRRCGPRWAARNTDVAGFMAPLLSRVTVAKMRATVLGAGGAARAVIDGLSSAGAQVTLSARSAGAAREIAAQTKVAVDEFPPRPGSWDLLVNTTPLGTTPDEDESPLPGGPFGGSLVYDLVYNPTETRFLREARASGCDTIEGLEMLVVQAGQQFEWWTGQKAPVGIMHEAARNALAARRAHLVTPGGLR